MRRSIHASPSRPRVSGASPRTRRDGARSGSGASGERFLFRFAFAFPNAPPPALGLVTSLAIAVFTVESPSAASLALLRRIFASRFSSYADLSCSRAVDMVDARQGERYSEEEDE